MVAVTIGHVIHLFKIPFTESWSPVLSSNLVRDNGRLLPNTTVATSFRMPGQILLYEWNGLRHFHGLSGRELLPGKHTGGDVLPLPCWDLLSGYRSRGPVRMSAVHSRSVLSPGVHSPNKLLGGDVPTGHIGTSG